MGFMSLSILGSKRECRNRSEDPHYLPKNEGDSKPPKKSKGSSDLALRSVNHVLHPADLSMENIGNGIACPRMPNYPTRLPVVKNNVTNV
jgi:hypothetical protein